MLYSTKYPMFSSVTQITLLRNQPLLVSDPGTAAWKLRNQNLTLSKVTNQTVHTVAHSRDIDFHRVLSYHHNKRSGADGTWQCRQQYGSE
jgi:hypothetical protein